MTRAELEQLAQVRRYRKLVEAYEALDARIDDLIMANDGSPDKMSEADRFKYRDLARRRTEILNDMRVLERQLDLTADEDSGAE